MQSISVRKKWILMAIGKLRTALGRLENFVRHIFSWLIRVIVLDSGVYDFSDTVLVYQCIPV